MCRAIGGAPLRISVAQRIFPVAKSTSYTIHRFTDDDLTLPWSSPGSYRPGIGMASLPVLTADVMKT